MMFLNKQGSLALCWGIVLSAALLSQPVQAATITLSGVISTDDAVQFFDVTVAAPTTVDLRSYGYAGGIFQNDSGTVVVPSGGFDTIHKLNRFSKVRILGDKKQ